MLYEATGPDDESGPLAGLFTFYNGQQTEPDPTLNAACQGEAPIYRNRSYVVFKDVPLTLFNDVVPVDLEFGLIEWRHLQADTTASSSPT